MALSVSGNSISVTNTKDGRSWVIETQQLSNGTTIVYEYLADVGADPQAIANARTTALPVTLEINEILANIYSIETFGSLATVTFTWSTAAQNASALRSAYQVATDRQVIMIGDFLNTLTATQLENAFGLNATQVANLQITLTNYASLASSIRGAVGS